MPKETSKKKLIALLKTKHGTQREIEKLQDELVSKLCPKGKQSCEPEYCAFRMTETCPFLKEYHEISKEVKHA